MSLAATLPPATSLVRSRTAFFASFAPCLRRPSCPCPCRPARVAGAGHHQNGGHQRRRNPEPGHANLLGSVLGGLSVDHFPTGNAVEVCPARGVGKRHPRGWRGGLKSPLITGPGPVVKWPAFALPPTATYACATDLPTFSAGQGSTMTRSTPPRSLHWTIGCLPLLEPSRSGRGPRPARAAASARPSSPTQRPPARVHHRRAPGHRPASRPGCSPPTSSSAC